MNHVDKYFISNSGMKVVAFCRDGEIIKEETYQLPMPTKYFDDKDKWIASGGTIKFLN